MKWPRNLGLGTLVGVALLIAWTRPAFTQAPSIGGYQQISEKRISLTVFEYTYRATLANTGPALGGATATVTSTSSATTIVEGTLAFGPVAAGGSVASTDTFIFRHNRTIPFSFTNLQWTITPLAGNQAPMVNAGPDRTVTLPNALALDGTATDDGQPGGTLTIAWSKVSGPGNVTFTPPGAAATSAAFSASGSYILRLSASDGALTRTDDVAVAVSPAPNGTPLANAGPDQAVAGAGTTVVLNGSGSSDPDGNPLTYQWSFVQQPAGSLAALVNPATVSPTIVPDRKGTYRVQLIVSDGVASSTPDTMDLTVANTVPLANAGPDQSIGGAGVQVTLDGSGSVDADGDPLTFQWVQQSGPAATLSSTSATQPTFVPVSKGTYVFRLVVGDGTVSSAPDMVDIVVANTAPVANAGPDQTGVVGQTVQLSGSGSSDADGDPLTFGWSVQSRPSASQAALVDPTSVTPTFVIDAAGTYVVRLIVSDGTVSSAFDTVIVSTINSAPVANAGPDQTTFVTQTVHLDGSASSDVDGNPLTFAWSFQSRPAGSTAAIANPAAVNPTFIPDRAGSYVIRLIVFDGTVNSSPDTVTVTTLNSAPVANAGADQTALVTQTVTLDGSASTDVDGNPLTYAWALTTRPIGSAAALSNPTAAQPTFVVDRPGTYVAQLIVNDGLVNSAPDTVTVTTLNTAPVANAGPDQTIVAGRLAFLDGSASSDIDGEPLTFAWSLLSRPAGSSAVLANPTSVGPSFLADRPGMYVAQLIVNDGTTNSPPDTVIVTTTNVAPVANAGPDQLALPVGATVTLSGLLSIDADGHPLTYSWSLLSRPAGSAAALSSPNSPTPTFTADAAGDYVAQLIVNDGFVNSAPDTVLIRTANRPPTASAGPDQTVPTGATVHLDGSGSGDPDLQPLTFSWVFQSTPAGSTATLPNPASVAPTFVADLAGAYILQLTVSDGVLSASDTVVVTAVTAQGTLSVAPASLTFPSTQVGQQTATQTITVTNTSVTPVSFSSVTASAGFGIASQNCTLVQGGQNCSIGVFFAPLSAGPTPGTVTIVSTAAASPHTVTLTGTGQPPSATVSPATLTFSDTPAGVTRVLPVTVQNTGVGPLTLTRDMTGPFTVDAAGTTCGATLASGSCLITVSFTPAAIGPATGTLTVTTDAGVFPVSLSATGVSPLTVTPASLSFADTVLGQTSAAQPVTLTNIGSQTIALSSIAVNAHFARTTTCAATLGAGQSCTVNVSFAPTISGLRTGTLTVTSSAPGSPHAVSLSGTGLVGVVSLSPGSLTFADTTVGQASATQTVTVSNTGNAPVAFGPASMPVTGDYAIANDACRTSGQGQLAAGATCTVTLRFQPTAPGLRPGTFTVTSTSVGVASQSTTLTGTGLAPLPEVSVIAVDPTASEVGPDPGLFRFSRTGPTTSPLTFRYCPGGTAAFNGDDYTPAPLSCQEPTFAIGQSTIDSVVTPVVESTIEGDETVVVTIVPQPHYTVGTSASATITITDSIPPEVSVVAVDPAASEVGPDPGTFRFSRTGPTTAQLTFTYCPGGTAAFNGADYAPAPIGCQTATFQIGQAAFDYTITPVVDAVLEGQETAILTIVDGLLYNVGASPSATITIADAPLPPATLTSTYAIEGGTGATFSISRTGSTAVARDVRVDIVEGVQGGTAALGVDYNFFNNPSIVDNFPNHFIVRIPAGQSSASFTMTALDDGVPEGTETVVLEAEGNRAIAPILEHAPATIGFEDQPDTIPPFQVFPPSYWNVGWTNWVQYAPYPAPYQSRGSNAIFAAADGARLTFQERTFVGAWLSRHPSAPGEIFFELYRQGVLVATSPVSTDTSAGLWFLSSGYFGLVDEVRVRSLGSTIAAGGSTWVMDDFTFFTAGSDRVLTPAPGSLTFPNTQVGEQSATQSVTVTSSGLNPVSVGNVTVSGDFSLSNHTCAALMPGQTCVVTVRFAPQAAGPRSGAITIASDGEGSPQTVPLNGTGVAASVTVTPSLSFPSTIVGATSPLTATVQNTGVGPVTVSYSISGPFSVSAADTTCGSTLSSGSCGIRVLFAPEAVGFVTGTLTVTTSAGVFSVPLSGTGISPLSVAPAGLTFPDTTVGQTSAAQIVTLTNNGTQPITMALLTVTAHFSRTTTCAATLAAGQSCMVSVSFAPTATNQLTGTLTVASSAPGSPHTVALSGRGVAGLLTLTPPGLTFAAQLLGTTAALQRIDVQNTGNQPVTITSVTVTGSGDFAIATNTCAGALAAGASCAIDVRFTPIAVGTRTGSIAIQSSAIASPHVAVLTGTGVASILSLPPLLNLGSEQVGTTGAPQTVTATNSGALPITFGAISIGGDFAITANTCAGTLAPSASCAVNVRFAPTVLGLRQGALTIQSNAAGNPHTVLLRGDGVPLPPATTSAASVLTFFNPAPPPPPNAPAQSASATGSLSYFNPASTVPPNPPAQSASATGSLSYFNPASTLPPNPPAQSASATGALSFFNPLPPAPPNVPAQSASAGQRVTFVNGPVIAAVSPVQVARNGQATTLTISGHNLSGATTVTLAPATGITVGSPTVSADGRTVTVSITVTASASPGVITVVVSGPGFSTPASTAASFVVQ